MATEQSHKERVESKKMTKQGSKLLRKLVKAEMRFTAILGRAAVRYDSGARKSKKAIALKTA